MRRIKDVDSHEPNLTPWQFFSTLPLPYFPCFVVVTNDCNSDALLVWRHTKAQSRTPACEGKPIEKYIYLSQLKHTNEDLFYRLCLANMPVCNGRYTYRRVVSIETGIGIHTYYIHPHCWGRMPTTFSHFSST